MNQSLHDIPQGTAIWKAFRRQGLGSSDIPVLFGHHEYKTPYELYCDKIGQGVEDEDNYAANRGRLLEGVAREWYEIETGIQMKPTCMVHKEHAFLRASLDGYNEQKRLVLEIKCPLKQEHIEMAKKGDIPKQYFIQMQHQLLVSEAVGGHYICFDGLKGEIIPVAPDLELQQEILKAGIEFWDRVINRIPPPLTNQDFMRSENANLIDYVSKYRTLKEAKDTAEKQLEALKATIERNMQHVKVICNGMKIQKVTRKGTDKDSTYILFSDTKK